MRLLITLTALALSAITHSQTLTIASDLWYPMNGEPDSDKPGYMIDLAKAIFEPNNINIQYVLLPWDRAVKQTRAGKYNCVVGAYKNDTPDFVFPKTHWGFDSPQLFIKKADNWKYSGNLNSLKDRRIGIIQGYNYSDEFDSYAKNQNSIHIQFIHGNNPLEVNIKKLMADRIDTIIESSNVFNAKLKDLKLTGKIKAAGNITQPIKMYMACSPKLVFSQTYVDLIDKEMVKLRKNGELKRILNRYGIELWNN